MDHGQVIRLMRLVKMLGELRDSVWIMSTRTIQFIQASRPIPACRPTLGEPVSSAAAQRRQLHCPRRVPPLHRQTRAGLCTRSLAHTR